MPTSDISWPLVASRRRNTCGVRPGALSPGASAAAASDMASAEYIASDGLGDHFSAPRCVGTLANTQVNKPRTRVKKILIGVENAVLAPRCMSRGQQ